MVAKDCPTKGSPKLLVGEIDTSAPFQSVKDAVNLFGEGAFSGEKPAIKKAKPHFAECVLAKEYQLQLVQKELNKLKDQLANAEITKAQALSELEKAKRTVDDLTSKLKIASNSKDCAVKAIEEAKIQVKQIQEKRSCNFYGNDGHGKQNLESSREEYRGAFAELDAAKQELRKTRHDFDAYKEEKSASVKLAAESQAAARVNLGKAGELSKEISTVMESIEQFKFASVHTHKNEAKLNDGKDIEKESYRTRVGESAKKLSALNKEVNSELIRNLEHELIETESQVDELRKEMDSTRTSDLDCVTAVTAEIGNAKESLCYVTQEETTLRQLVQSLKMDLENAKKEISEVKAKEAETEYVASNLHVKLRISKYELAAAVAEESKIEVASGEMLSTLHQLSLENESARCETETIKLQAEDLKMEAEVTRIVQEEEGNKLKFAWEEVEEAKAAEARALEQIKILSERTNPSRVSAPEPGTQITISKEEFESLSRKVKESDKLAEMKVAAAMAQVEAVKASENEALKKLEATSKEIDDMKAATQEALKRAEMAEAAKKAVEGELRRWREREEKMEAEAAARIREENNRSISLSPINRHIQKENPTVSVTEVRKLERAKTSVSKKVLKPSISAMFSRKKNRVEGGYPSYLPGEQHL